LGIVGAILWIIRKSVNHRDAPDSFNLLDLWLGTTERAIAMALAVWAPDNLAAFIGAWTVAKLAANWGRLKGEDDYVRTGHLIALIGCALSFVLPVVGALLIERILGKR
jgi:hypothetical protein